MATSVTTLTNLLQTARDFAFDISDTKADRVLTAAINDTLRFLNRLKPWPHLQVVTSKINLRPAYLTGHASIQYGAATVSGTTCAWAQATHAGWKMQVNGEWPDYQVTSVRAAGTILLNAAWPYTTVSAGSYVLYQDRYAAPTNLGQLYSVMGKNEGAFWAKSWDEWLQYKRSFTGAGSGKRCYYSDREYVYVWPYPAEAETVEFPFTKQGAALSTGSQTLDGLWDDAMLDVLHAGMECTVRRMLNKISWMDWAKTLTQLGEDAWMQVGDVNALPIVKQPAYGGGEDDDGPGWNPLNSDNVVVTGG